MVVAFTLKRKIYCEFTLAQLSAFAGCTNSASGKKCRKNQHVYDTSIEHQKILGTYAPLKLQFQSCPHTDIICKYAINQSLNYTFLLKQQILCQTIAVLSGNFQDKLCVREKQCYFWALFTLYITDFTSFLLCRLHL